MNADDFTVAVQHYRGCLEKLEAAGDKPSQGEILAALTARDAVQLALDGGEGASITPAAAGDLTLLTELDGRLKALAVTVCRAVRLGDLRRSYLPPEGAWWWRLEGERPPARMDRLDWLWSLLAILVVTLAISLLLDIIPRFFSGGPDALGAFTVMIQGVLTALVAGGALTKGGREFTDRILKGMQIPESWWVEVKLLFMALLLASLVILRFSLDEIAVGYNNRGQQSFAAGRLTSAEYDFKRAIKLYPDYPQAHYNLGVFYEDLDDLKSAKTEYQLALKAGMPQAYNNLGRLYILEKQFDTAVRLLLTGRQRNPHPRTLYSLLKNLGWARLGQKRYAEAAAYLQEALQIDPAPAPAHCLLAQVLEGQDDSMAAATEWELCRQKASPFRPDEDLWLGMAAQR